MLKVMMYSTSGGWYTITTERKYYITEKDIWDVKYFNFDKYCNYECKQRNIL